jgi:hypothetical protein
MKRSSGSVDGESTIRLEIVSSNTFDRSSSE